jgi:hypothetical protein
MDSWSAGGAAVGSSIQWKMRGCCDARDVRNGACAQTTAWEDDGEHGLKDLEVRSERGYYVGKIAFAISGITNHIRPDKVSSGCLTEI